MFHAYLHDITLSEPAFESPSRVWLTPSALLTPTTFQRWHFLNLRMTQLLRMLPQATHALLHKLGHRFVSFALRVCIIDEFQQVTADSITFYSDL